MVSGISKQIAAQRRLFKRQRGFSLLELTITLAIMTLLVGMAIPVTRNQVKRQREEELRIALRTLRSAIDAFHRDAAQGLISELDIDSYDPKTRYPTSLKYLVDGVKTRGLGDKTLRYLRRIPQDPMSRDIVSDDQIWGYRSTEDPPDTTSWDGQNIYDVYSKSPGTALNGTPYRDW